MLRLAGAAALFGHGVVHLIGFVVPFQITQLEGFAYRTTALNGSIALGETGARVLGLVWLLLAVGFVVVAVGLARGHQLARPAVVGLAVVSTIACVLGLPDAVAGIIVNVAILAVVAYVTGRGAAQTSR